MVQKYGFHRGRQQYRCGDCGHQFLNPTKEKRWPKQAYQSYCQGKQTFVELSQKTKKSVRTLQRHFDHVHVEPAISKAPVDAINLILDATFLSRTDGVLIFRAQKKNLHWRFITSESLAEIEAGLTLLKQQGYQFQSITIDGRRGVIQLIERLYPGLPIQLCQFHQVQIIRRYTTNSPKTACGKELKQLMKLLTQTTYEQFTNLFISFCVKYDDFLKERNEQGQFIHRRLRSAKRSLKTNLPYLFTYRNYPELAIPNTTNSCDGSFAHWKQKVKIHRGLKRERRNKMVNFLLNQD